MAFKKHNEMIIILTLMLIGVPIIASTGIDCAGRSFHCVNNTHFMICVDLGGGLSMTVDGYAIECPPTTTCHPSNRFECEYEPLTPVPTTTTSVSEVTNELSVSTQPWEEITVSSISTNSTHDSAYFDLSNSTTSEVTTLPATTNILEVNTVSVPIKVNVENTSNDFLQTNTGVTTEYLIDRNITSNNKQTTIVPDTQNATNVQNVTQEVLDSLDSIAVTTEVTNESLNTTTNININDFTQANLGVTTKYLIDSNITLSDVQTTTEPDTQNATNAKNVTQEVLNSLDSIATTTEVTNETLYSTISVDVNDFTQANLGVTTEYLIDTNINLSDVQTTTEPDTQNATNAKNVTQEVLNSLDSIATTTKVTNETLYLTTSVDVNDFTQANLGVTTEYLMDTNISLSDVQTTTEPDTQNATNAKNVTQEVLNSLDSIATTTEVTNETLYLTTSVDVNDFTQANLGVTTEYLIDTNINLSDVQTTTEPDIQNATKVTQEVLNSLDSIATTTEVTNETLYSTIIADMNDFTQANLGVTTEYLMDTNITLSDVQTTTVPDKQNATNAQNVTLNAMDSIATATEVSNEILYSTTNVYVNDSSQANLGVTTEYLIDTNITLSDVQTTTVPDKQNATNAQNVTQEALNSPDSTAVTTEVTNETLNATTSNININDFTQANFRVTTEYLIDTNITLSDVLTTKEPDAQNATNAQNVTLNSLDSIPVTTEVTNETLNATTSNININDFTQANLGVTTEYLIDINMTLRDVQTATEPDTQSTTNAQNVTQEVLNSPESIAVKTEVTNETLDATTSININNFTQANLGVTTEYLIDTNITLSDVETTTEPDTQNATNAQNVALNSMNSIATTTEVSNEISHSTTNVYVNDFTQANLGVATDYLIDTNINLSDVLITTEPDAQNAQNITLNSLDSIATTTEVINETLYSTTSIINANDVTQAHLGVPTEYLIDTNNTLSDVQTTTKRDTQSATNAQNVTQDILNSPDSIAVTTESTNETLNATTSNININNFTQANLGVTTENLIDTNISLSDVLTTTEPDATNPQNVTLNTLDSIATTTEINNEMLYSTTSSINVNDVTQANLGETTEYLKDTQNAINAQNVGLNSMDSIATTTEVSNETLYSTTSVDVNDFTQANLGVTTEYLIDTNITLSDVQTTTEPDTQNATNVKNVTQEGLNSLNSIATKTEVTNETLYPTTNVDVNDFTQANLGVTTEYITGKNITLSDVQTTTIPDKQNGTNAQNVNLNALESIATTIEVINEVFYSTTSSINVNNSRHTTLGVKTEYLIDANNTLSDVQSTSEPDTHNVTNAQNVTQDFVNSLEGSATTEHDITNEILHSTTRSVPVIQTVVSDLNIINNTNAYENQSSDTQSGGSNNMQSEVDYNITMAPSHNNTGSDSFTTENFSNISMDSVIDDLIVTTANPLHMSSVAVDSVMETNTTNIPSPSYSTESSTVSFDGTEPNKITTESYKTIATTNSVSFTKDNNLGVADLIDLNNESDSTTLNYNESTIGRNLSTVIENEIKDESTISTAGNSPGILSFGGVTNETPTNYTTENTITETSIVNEIKNEVNSITLASSEPSVTKYEVSEDPKKILISPVSLSKGTEENLTETTLNNLTVENALASLTTENSLVDYAVNKETKSTVKITAMDNANNVISNEFVNVSNISTTDNILSESTTENMATENTDDKTNEQNTSTDKNILKDVLLNNAAKGTLKTSDTDTNLAKSEIRNEPNIRPTKISVTEGNVGKIINNLPELMLTTEINTYKLKQQAIVKTSPHREVEAISSITNLTKEIVNIATETNTTLRSSISNIVIPTTNDPIYTNDIHQETLNGEENIKDPIFDGNNNLSTIDTTSVSNDLTTTDSDYLLNDLTRTAVSITSVPTSELSTTVEISTVSTVNEKTTNLPIPLQDLKSDISTLDKNPVYQQASQPGVTQTVQLMPNEMNYLRVNDHKNSSSQNHHSLYDTELSNINSVINKKTNASTNKISLTNQSHSLVNANHDTLKKTKDLSFSCINRVRGRYGDSEDCRKFYICVGRLQAVEGKCPVNTVFSEIRKRCTRNLSHCIRNNEFKCTKQERFIDLRRDDTYYMCVQNNHGHFIRFKFQCQAEYTLDKNFIKCVHNADNSNQSASSKANEKKPESKHSRSSSSERNSSKSKRTKKEKRSFECEEEGKFPVCDNCREYFVCSIKNKSEFRRKKKRCDSDEIFDKDKRKCVSAESNED